MEDLIVFAAGVCLFQIGDLFGLPHNIIIVSTKRGSVGKGMWKVDYAKLSVKWADGFDVGREMTVWNKKNGCIRQCPRVSKELPGHLQLDTLAKPHVSFKPQKNREQERLPSPLPLTPLWPLQYANPGTFSNVI